MIELIREYLARRQAARTPPNVLRALKLEELAREFVKSYPADVSSEHRIRGAFDLARVWMEEMDKGMAR
jgi:hypothetical protein